MKKSDAIIGTIDRKIKEYSGVNYKKVTYNIGFIDGLKFAKNLITGKTEEKNS